MVQADVSLHSSKDNINHHIDQEACGCSAACCTPQRCFDSHACADSLLKLWCHTCLVSQLLQIITHVLLCCSFCHPPTYSQSCISTRQCRCC
jgi:hypothetical protein